MTYDYTNYSISDLNESHNLNVKILYLNIELESCSEMNVNFGCSIFLKILKCCH